MAGQAGWPGGSQELRKHGKVRLDWWLLGVGNNQSSRGQATRLYTTSYQTVRIQDWKDYIDLQGAILITLASTAWWPQGAGGSALLPRLTSRLANRQPTRRQHDCFSCGTAPSRTPNPESQTNSELPDSCFSDFTLFSGFHFLCFDLVF